MTPLILPLGDRGLLIRFGEMLTDEANMAAIALAVRVEAECLPGVVEVVPNLISVLLRYDAAATTFERLASEVRLVVSAHVRDGAAGIERRLPVVFDGEDLGAVANFLGLSHEAFVAAHNSSLLRVLATGFAPGFVYCGMHPAPLMVPRRSVIRRQVPPGTVLFAAGQTAITSTPIPTGWHIIGHTAFRNFDPERDPPSPVVAGDMMRFEVA